MFSRAWRARILYTESRVARLESVLRIFISSSPVSQWMSSPFSCSMSSPVKAHMLTITRWDVLERALIFLLPLWKTGL